MMKKVDYKELEKVNGGTNWMGVGSACLSGAADSFTGGLGDMFKGCLKGATKDWAKQQIHRRHKHR